MENNLSKAKGRKEKEKSKQQTKEKKKAAKQIISTPSKSQTPLGGYRKS
jgi:hypothetical protein